MATALTVQTLDLGLTKASELYAGLAPTFAAATVTVGDKALFPNPSKGFFVIKNASAAAIYAKIVAGSYNPQGVKDDIGDGTVSHGVVVAAGTGTTNEIPGVTYLGPFDDASLRDSDGYVTVICSAVTSVTIAAIQMADKGRG